MAIQDEIHRIVGDEVRANACLKAIESIITGHINAASGVSNPGGPLNYQFKARTAEEIQATLGLDATRIAPQRPTSQSDGAPPRHQQPTQPAQPATASPRSKTPW